MARFLIPALTLLEGLYHRGDVDIMIVALTQQSTRAVLPWGETWGASVRLLNHTSVSEELLDSLETTEEE